MERFIVGQVVSVDFPFSDLATLKKRPAIIVAVADFGDLILCQVTSKPYSSSKAIPLVATDFQNGRLPVDSFIRPDKLFTVASSRINKVHGLLSAGKIKLVKQSLRDIFK